MKKVLVLLAMVLGATNMFAQDYDLQGLAKLCQKYELRGFQDGLCRVYDEERGDLFFDTKGKEVLCVSEYDTCNEDFSNGLLLAKNIDGKYGYLNKSGKVAIPFVFDYASSFLNGVAKVEKGNKKYHINTKGNEVTLEDHSGSLEVEIDEKLAQVIKGIGLSVKRNDGKWGALNANGEIVIPFIYDRLDININELIKAEKKNKYGWLDKNGKTVIPIQFDRADDFSDGLAFVILNNSQGFVDKYGNSTFNPHTTTTNNNVQNTNTEAIDVTETMPSFVGGKEQLNKWLAANIHYPELALENGIKGTVVASVAIEPDGSIGEVTIKKSVDPLLDKETIRIFKSMPRWNPGTQNGKPVRVVLDMPLNFNFTEE